MSDKPLHNTLAIPLWKSAVGGLALTQSNQPIPVDIPVDIAADLAIEEFAAKETAAEQQAIEQPAEAEQDELEKDKSKEEEPPRIDSLDPVDDAAQIKQCEPIDLPIDALIDESVDEPVPSYHVTIQELPQDLRPRERLAYAGPASLNTAELLAIILRTGRPGENVLRMSERLLTHFNGIKGLAQANFQELCSVHGIGEAKAAQIQSALELGKRLLLAAPHELPRIHNPTDIANMLMLEMGLLEQEQLRIVLLDTRYQVLRISTVYRGSLNAAVVRVGEIFREAIRANSAAIILVHNHPSGDPRPSPEDTHTTRMIVDAGKLLDIDVLDHLIIGDRCYVSMKEKGLGF